MKRPNVLLIMADQLRQDALGCYGNNEINTPNIDKLALMGSTFNNHYIQNPVCTPSRCSIMTGRYPHAHGTIYLGMALSESETTIADVFRTNGYETAAFGKMHISPLLDKFGNALDDEPRYWPETKYGFNTTHLSCDNKTGEYLEYLRITHAESYELVKKQGEDKVEEDIASGIQKRNHGLPQVFESKLDCKYHQSSWITDRTIDFINNTKDPFFAVCSYVDPHHPFDPPEPYASMYDPAMLSAPIEAKTPELAHFLRHKNGTGLSNEKYDYTSMDAEDFKIIKAKYYGMISLIDDCIGKILAALSENEMLNDTIIAFTTDHGELLGDHGLLFKGPFHYESLIKAPFIIAYPQAVPCGSRYSAITEHVDIMPTLLTYAGIEVPNAVQGNSISHIVNGNSYGKAFALIENHCLDWGLIMKTIVNREFKLTYYLDEPFGELYDLVNDANELSNLWDDSDYREIKAYMKDKLLERLIQTEDLKYKRMSKY